MLVIIHGWSDTHQTFMTLGRRLVQQGVIPDVTHLRLGNYISLDDDITFDDLIYALNFAWAKEGLPTSPRSVDVIVHSTGALVVRHWMTTFYTPTTNPIQRLLMLAPANFGSPLAHKGRSFAGRVVKGFTSERRFHTGTHILKGLELASPFTWELSQRDRFNEQTWYGPGRILCTVLVGTSGYTGISAAANENGTDGTVRVSTAHLNPGFVTLDFSADPQKPKFIMREAKGDTAFARISGINHSTITLKGMRSQGSEVFEIIKEALQVNDSNFHDFIRKLNDFSDAERDRSKGKRFTQSYRNAVVRLTDNTNSYVPDYFLEVFAKNKDSSKVNDQLTRVIQEDVIETVHAYGDNAAYRSFLFNTTCLGENVITPRRPLFISVTAVPDIIKTKTVGYSTFGYDDIGSIQLEAERMQEFFRPDRTLLVDLIILREQADKVFSC